MIFVMKQMNSFELGITYSENWLKRQGNLLKRYVFPFEFYSESF